MTNINIEVGNRLRTFINSLGLKSIAEFCRQAKMERGTVDKILKGDNGPRVETLGQIISAFPELRLNWLVHGDGEMLEAILDDEEIYLTAMYRKFIKAKDEPRLTMSFMGAVQWFAKEHEEWERMNMNAKAVSLPEEEILDWQADLLLDQHHRRFLSEVLRRLVDIPKGLLEEETPRERIEKNVEQTNDRIQKKVNLQKEEL